MNVQGKQNTAKQKKGAWHGMDDGRKGGKENENQYQTSYVPYLTLPYLPTLHKTSSLFIAIPFSPSLQTFLFPFSQV